MKRRYYFLLSAMLLVASGCGQTQQSSQTKETKVIETETEQAAETEAETKKG